WPAMVRRRVLDPLGMAETYVDLPAGVRPRMAAGHSPVMDTVPLWTFDVLAGAGALRSTAADMLTYLEAHLTPEKTPLTEALTTAQGARAAFLGNGRIALGWLVRGDTTAPTLFHNGGTAGFSSIAIFSPSRQLGVVVLSNAGVPIDDIALHIVDASV